MGFSAAAVKKEIEARLASRIPAALSPVQTSTLRLHPSGTSELDRLLDGGFPLGSLCEITGPDCSGRTAIALSLLRSASQESACAYVDVSDCCSPHTAAAAGVALRNLLWVRFPAGSEPPPTPALENGAIPSTDNTRERQQLNQQHCGGPHPRSETKGLAPALEQMLLQNEERRKRKMEGTPGHPNLPIGLSQASADQVEWEQFNFRKVDDRDPRRQLDKAAAETARQRSATIKLATHNRERHEKPWTLLDRALRATDQILQAGGFRVVVLDLASIPTTQAERIPPATWWRYQKAAQHSDAILLVLSRTVCARSSASCVLECSAGDKPKLNGLLSSTQHIAQISRQRTGPAFGKKAPGRVTSWHSAPAWMQAVGR